MVLPPPVEAAILSEEAKVFDGVYGQPMPGFTMEGRQLPRGSANAFHFRVRMPDGFHVDPLTRPDGSYYHYYITVDESLNVISRLMSDEPIDEDGQSEATFILPVTYQA